MLGAEAWVADGNYGSTLEMRFAAADTIIDMDRSRLICLWRVIGRAVKNRRTTRSDMRPGCPVQRGAPSHSLTQAAQSKGGGAGSRDWRIARIFSAQPLTSNAQRPSSSAALQS